MSEVVLYWYDITQGMARNLSPMFLGRQLEGVWHTSIVAYGCEFYFVGGVGILRDTTPGATRFGVPFRRSPLGRTTKTADEFLRWTVDQRGTNFGPWSYSLLTNNCNHFTQAASQFLLQMDIPADIRDMIPNLLSTPLGQMLRPTLERMTSMMEGAASSVGLNPATRSMDVHTTGSPVNVSQPPATPGTGGLLSLRSGLSSSEEDDLSLALVMLESNELVADGKVEGYQNTLLALTTLMTVWQNIMDHPTEAKYRGLSTSSETYRTKIAPLEDFGVVDLLHLAGFRIRPHASGNGGQQWALSDNDGSLPVLQRLTSEVEGLINNMECSLAVAMSLAEENARVEAERAASAPSVLEYFLSPVPEDFTPLHVGSENGAPLFSILVDEVHGSRHCFGKCRFVSDRHLVEGSPTQIEAYYCSPDGKEVRLPSGCAYRLLCVRKGCEDQLLWLPSSMIACSPSVEDFMYRGYGRFGVVRAPIRGSVHPGVREPAGRCVVPYGGEARVVTEVAQVLCERACMPEEVLRIADELYDGEHRLTEWEHQQGMCPMGSFDELLSWEPPTLSDAQTVCPLHPRAPRRGNSGSSAKVLLCHDMRGGYLEGDAPFFTCSSSMGGPVVDGSYTLQHWSSVDAFVYFSHHRVTVPPREWVSAGHRHGVPVLGTIIVEGGAGEAECDFMLIDAQRMARIVEQLVRLCDHHHFDGYMLNMESPMDVTLAQRLPAFCSMLRQKLNESAAAGTMRSVVWYDAVTIDGNVFYQNALTLKNKAFFDVCDGIMTNYFWNPMHIALSRTAAANRPEDVFVGVDVFGRRMFGGGGYNTSVAVENAVRGGLSVALFAPGWSMEVEGGGSREKFLRSDARLWSKMLKHLAAPHTLTLEAETSLPAWTAFSSGIGRGPFRVAGKSVTSAGSHWCSLSSAHTFLPPRRPLLAEYGQKADDDEEGKKGSECFGLPFSGPGVAVGDVLLARWDASTAWYGDRSLTMELPPHCLGRVMDVRVLLPTSAAQDLVVDVAWRVSGDGRHPALKATLERNDPNRGTSAHRAEVDLVELDDVLYADQQWEVRRYTLESWSPSSEGAEPTALRSLLLYNQRSDCSMRCVVGAMAVSLVPHNEIHDSSSALIPGPLEPATQVVLHPTLRSTEWMMEMELPSMEVATRVAVFADVIAATEGEEVGVPVRTFMGEHILPSTVDRLQVRLVAPSTSRVSSAHFCRLSL